MRLIDAEGVIEEIKRNKLLAREPATERCMEIIRNATTYVYPTAYDPDMVIEQLEKRIKDAEKVIVKNPADKLDEIANDTAEAFIEAYKDAIRIVRAGNEEESK